MHVGQTVKFKKNSEVLMGTIEEVIVYEPGQIKKPGILDEPICRARHDGIFYWIFESEIIDYAN